MFAKKFLLALVLLFSTLHSDLIDPNVQAATEGDPGNTLCESVSLLTGDFVVFSEDLCIEGAEPLSIHRRYISGDGSGINGGWEFFPHEILRMIPSKTKGKKDKDFRRIRVREPNGTTLIFKRTQKIDVSKGWVPYEIDFEKHGKGITNLSRGTISGQSNLRNYRLYQVTKNRIELITSDGTKRYYSRGSWRRDTPIFELKREKLPNGNQIFYKYDDKNRLNYIKTTCPSGKKIYAWCRLHYGKGHDFTIETSDKRELSYTFGKDGTDSNYYLKKVSGPELPNEKEKYQKSDGGSKRIVKRRMLPQGRALEVKYYLPDNRYQVGEEEAKVHAFDDEAAYRVRALLQPFGVDGKLFPTHHFVYEMKKEKVDGERVYTSNGITKVYDSDLNKTLIEYSPHFLRRCSPISLNAQGRSD